MKNKKITRKISQGVYVLTTKGGGCIVDAVSQVSSGDNPLLAVSVMKTNYTHELMKENQTFCLSVLGIISIILFLLLGLPFGKPLLPAPVFLPYHQHRCQWIVCL